MVTTITRAFAGVESIWAPHPFITISAAGNVNASKASAATSRRLLDRVFGKLDARTRTHFAPSPSPFGRSTSPGTLPAEPVTVIFLCGDAHVREQTD